MLLALLRSFGHSFTLNMARASGLRPLQALGGDGRWGWEQLPPPAVRAQGEVITWELCHSLLCAFQTSTISPPHRPPAALLVSGSWNTGWQRQLLLTLSHCQGVCYLPRPSQHLPCGRLLLLTCPSPCYPAWSQELGEVDSQLLLAGPASCPGHVIQPPAGCPRRAQLGGSVGVRGPLELRSQDWVSISAPLLSLEQVLCAASVKWVCVSALFTSS